jgi:Histone-like transcription factor (CBF/NF-Y) and archaeal histone
VQPLWTCQGAHIRGVALLCQLRRCPTLQDALLALSEGAKVFIQYLTAAANAVCKGAGRQTLSEDDVYAALADIQFAEFVPPLQEAAKGETTSVAYTESNHSSRLSQSIHENLLTRCRCPCDASPHAHPLAVASVTCHELLPAHYASRRQHGHFHAAGSYETAGQCVPPDQTQCRAVMQH